MDVIHFKTAKLFEAAAQLGAVLCKAPAQLETDMAKYGMHLGTAFQLIDDVLDYSSNSETIGKNIGDDLAEGKPTLPLIRAMSVGDTAHADTIRGAIVNGGRDNIQDVMKAIESTDALAYTAHRARQEADLALSMLQNIPESEYKDALANLAEFSVNRTY
jgi:octaprenyl-diphosphate synthase